MFRLMISVIYLVLTVVGSYGIYLAVDDSAEPMENKLRKGVQMSHRGYDALADLRDIKLRDIAMDIANSEVNAYVSALEEYRNQLLTNEEEAYARFPGEHDQVGGDRQAYIAGQEEFLAAMSEKLAKRIETIRGPSAWADQSREDYVKMVRGDIVACNSYAVSNCMFNMTWRPLKDVVDTVRKENRYGLRPDLVIVSDARGTGRADVDRPKWSKDDGFAEKYPLLRKAKEGKVARDVVALEGTDSYYFVSAAPIMDGGTFRGTVLVGVAIDGPLLKQESRVLGWNLSYLDGTKLIKSSLSDKLQGELRLNLPSRTEDPVLATKDMDNLIAQFVPIRGNYSNGDVQAILTVNRSDAMAPIDSIKSIIPLYAVMMFLIGMAMFIWLIREQTKPLVEIDSGIHEIITGNHDFEFKSDYKDKLWVAFAKSLNRMVGILQGRDLEEDDLEEYMGLKTRDMEAVAAPESFLDEPPQDDDQPTTH